MANSVWVDDSPIAATQQVGPVAPNTSAPPFTFTSDTSSGLASSANSVLDFVTGGTSRATVSNSAFNLVTGTAFSTNGDSGTTGKVLIGGTSSAWTASPSITALTLSAAVTAATAVLSGKITTYNNVPTAGWGSPSIVGYARATAQSAANASVVTYTVGAADGTFQVSMNLNCTATTSLITTLTCTYTDESNTGRTLILPVTQLSGSFIALGAVTGLGAWESPVMHIRAKATTTITLLTSSGTYTGVTYTVEGLIVQVA